MGKESRQLSHIKKVSERESATSRLCQKATKCGTGKRHSRQKTQQTNFKMLPISFRENTRVTVCCGLSKNNQLVKVAMCAFSAVLNR